MDFHGITMKGPFYIEQVSSLPTSNEENRMVYYDGNIYYNNGSQWIKLITSISVTGEPDDTYVKIDGSNLNTSIIAKNFFDAAGLLNYIEDSELTLDNIRSIINVWLNDGAAPLCIENTFSEFTTNTDLVRSQDSPQKWSGKPTNETQAGTLQSRARYNLGLGSISTHDESEYAEATHTHSNLDSLEINEMDDMLVIVNIWLKNEMAPLLANNNLSELTTSPDEYTTQLSPMTYSGKPTTITQQNNKQSEARTNLGLGNIATINYFFSTADPTGGTNGDVWYQPTT